MHKGGVIIHIYILAFRHLFLSSSIHICTNSYENIQEINKYNVTTTLTLPFKLMACRYSKCVYLWNPTVLWTDCIKPVTSIVFKCFVFTLLTARLYFVGQGAPLLVLCHIGLILSVFIAISHISAVQLFTHSLQSLPTITRSPPEVIIMNKRTIKVLSCQQAVKSSHILPSDSTVPRSGTSQTSASCPHSLLLHPDVSSVRPDKPVT
jgi:hypothetical protein